jgi:serine/threonine protein kinase
MAAYDPISAPELFLDEDAPLNTKADVYSFGIILWELLTCEVPYPDINDLKEVYDEIVVNGTPGTTRHTHTTRTHTNCTRNAEMSDTS